MSIKESKKMNFEELDGVAGGTNVETVADSVELYKRGLLNSEYDSCAAVRNKLHEMGYGGYVDNGGMLMAISTPIRMATPSAASSSGQTLIRRTIRRLSVAVNWIR